MRIHTKYCQIFIGFVCSWALLCYFILWFYWHGHSNQPIRINNKVMVIRRLRLAEVSTSNESASERESVKGLEKKLPNVPLIYLYDNENKPYVYRQAFTVATLDVFKVA